MNSHHVSVLQDAKIDDGENTQKLHYALVEKHKSNFVGRKALIKECIKHVQEIKTGIVMMSGKAGTGKSAFMVRVTI